MNAPEPVVTNLGRDITRMTHVICELDHLKNCIPDLDKRVRVLACIEEIHAVAMFYDERLGLDLYDCEESS